MMTLVVGLGQGLVAPHTRLHRRPTQAHNGEEDEDKEGEGIQQLAHAALYGQSPVQSLLALLRLGMAAGAPYSLPRQPRKARGLSAMVGVVHHYELAETGEALPARTRLSYSRSWREEGQEGAHSICIPRPSVWVLGAGQAQATIALQCIMWAHPQAVQRGVGRHS